MPGGTICRGYCLVFEPDPSWPEELDLVRERDGRPSWPEELDLVCERDGRAVSAGLGLDLTS